MPSQPEVYLRRICSDAIRKRAEKEVQLKEGNGRRQNDQLSIIQNYAQDSQMKNS